MKTLFQGISILIVITTSRSDISAQTNKERVNMLIYNCVAKNIYAFNLRNASYYFNGIIPREVLEGGPYDFFNTILPDATQKLMMEIDTINLIYPEGKYKVFKIHVGDFRFSDTVSNMISVSKSSGLRTTNFLIAVDVDSEYPRVKYISGQFYPTRISYDFNIDLENPNSCLEYLKFRLYAFKVDNIKFYKRIEDGLLFSGYSAEEKTDIQIILPKNDIERPRIFENSSSLE